MLHTALSAILAASVVTAQLNAADIPLGMLQLCAGKDAAGLSNDDLQKRAIKNIISWTDVPHDWNDAVDGKGDGSGRYIGKDWWYWGDDWKQKIADGDVGQEPSLADEYARFLANKPLLGKCSTNGGAQEIKTVQNVNTLSACRKACALEYSTTTVLREKCQYFSWDSKDAQCKLWWKCGWQNGQLPIPAPNGQTENGPTFDTSDNDDDANDEACFGQDTRGDDCSWTGTVWKTYRLVDIYPAGFKPYSLREFNEPPLCFHVPRSADNKVEVMVETEMNDSRVCVMDGRDMGVFNNDVGNVRTCDNGKLYSCFTAASTNQDSDFFFYVSCEGSCEASDVDLWVRMRKSEKKWSDGKTDWENDIEYWCEQEKGTTYEKDGELRDEFTFPSELLPDEPREYPYRIKYPFPDSANSVSTALACLAGLVAAYFVM